MPGGAPAQLDEIHRERHQAAPVGKEPVAVYRGQPGALGQPNQRLALSAEHRVTGNEEGINPIALHRLEGPRELGRVPYGDFAELKVQPRALPYDGPAELLVNGIGHVPEKGHALGARSHIAKHLEPLLDKDDAAPESRDVLARLEPVRDDAEVDRVSSRHEDD